MKKLVSCILIALRQNEKPLKHFKSALRKAQNIFAKDISKTKKHLCDIDDRKIRDVLPCVEDGVDPTLLLRSLRKRLYLHRVASGGAKRVTGRQKSV